MRSIFNVSQLVSKGGPAYTISYWTSTQTSAESRGKPFGFIEVPEVPSPPDGDWNFFFIVCL